MEHYFDLDKKFFLVFILTFLFRFAWLSDIPFRVDGDAARMALDGLSAWESKVPLFSTGWFGYQNLFFYINGFFVKLFGEGIFAMRFFSALGGVFSVWFTYLLGKELFDRKIGLLSAFFLSLLPIHLAFSRNGTDMIQGAWLAPLVLYVTILGLKRHTFFSF